MAKSDDTAERMAVGCLGLLFGTLAIAWIGFVGWMIFWVVSWLTSK